MRIFLTIITTLSCAPKAILGALNKPRNVHMTSYNMDMVLRWDPPEPPSEVSYWTEYHSTVTNYSLGCVNTSLLYCDLSALGHSLTGYGTYQGRVRAQRGRESSGWVESMPLTLDKHTIIGPPNVTLVSNGVHMTINIRDPVFRISELRRLYNQASYNITYWKKGEQDKAQSLQIQQNPIILSDLKPMRMYCVKVHIKTLHNLITSQESPVTCQKTTNKERAPWLEAVVTFVVMVMVVTMAVVAVIYHKKLSNFLCPTDSLPQYFKKNVFETPSSVIYVENYRPPVETYDPVDVMTTENNTDEGRPLVAEEDHCSARFPTAEEPQTSGSMSNEKCALVPKGEHVITKDKS